MNTPVKLVIFDWDGTLFDSVSQIVASLQFAAQQFQQPLSDEDAKSIIGLGLPEVAQRLFPNVPELHANILQSYSEHYVANSSGDSWFEGVVATGKSRKGLDRVLKQTNSEQLFVTTRAASETRSKPDPLMLEEILAETGVQAEHALMVGDTSYDLEMAQNMAMPSIGVSYGVHEPELLAQFNPVCIVDDVTALHAALLAKVQWKQAI